MFNTKNICEFEGRLSSDITATTIGQGTTAFTKVVFSIAVDRVLTTAQKATKKAEQNLPFDQKTVISADFVQLQATGKTAEAIQQCFVKGKPIKVFCTYKTWVTTDAQGTKKYGSGFDIEHFGFTTSDTTGNNANGGATNNAAPAGNTNTYSKPNTKVAEDVVPIDDGDVPF